MTTRSMFVIRFFFYFNIIFRNFIPIWFWLVGCSSWTDFVWMPNSRAFRSRNLFPTEHPLTSAKSYNSHLSYLGPLEITLLIYTPSLQKTQISLYEDCIYPELILFKVGGSTSDTPFFGIAQNLPWGEYRNSINKEATF